MKIAIVHYHLRRGGVTRVIENAIASLPADEVEVCVLAGEAYSGDADIKTQVVPGLGYLHAGDAAMARQLASDMFQAAKEQLGGPPDVWHIHNHNLGKNVCFPQALSELILDGARVLLQIHDFAEDGRPTNYARQRSYYHDFSEYRRHLYPRGSQIQYATLNSRDLRHLKSAGVYNALLHLLPNSVEAPPSAPGASDPFPGKKVCLYPTRGIRRKNLGELFLLSKLAGPDTVFLSTLEPENPEWKSIHQDWVDFGREQDFPVYLGYGETSELSYPELIHRADTLVTTSITEGFGLAFLEPWLVDKTVVGRKLPMITGDFSKQGVSLDHLYRRLEIPLSWIDADTFRECLETGLQDSYNAYGRDLPDDAMERLWNASVRQGMVDFGRLNEPLQRQALQNFAPDVIEMPTLDPIDSELQEANRRLVEDSYGRAGYGELLLQIYHSVATSPLDDVTYHDPDAILDSFLRPEDFMLLKSSS